MKRQESLRDLEEIIVIYVICSMKEKIYNIIISVNTIILVLAAIFTVVGSPAGSFLFVYTSSIGFIDSMKNKNVHGVIINSTFLAMNLFFVIRFLMNC